MKVLIFCVIFIAAQAGAEDPADKYINCARVRCARPVPPVCPPGTMLIKLSTPRPGKCCNPYECIQDCTLVKCGRPLPVSCPADSVLIKGITLPGQCCPQPGRCECKPAGCVKQVCQRGYISVLVSKGSGKPGDCCDVYKCKLDCTKVMCRRPLPKSCPEDSVLIEGIILPGQCCPQPGRCECRPAGCVKKKCQPGYVSVLVSPASGMPGDCCDIYECEQDCTTVTCGRPLPESCPLDSVWIEGITLPGQCCPQPGRCECKPDGCLKQVCQRGYISVLVSKGSGKPGDCCDVYDCKLDCTTVTCEKPLHEICPADSLFIEGITLPGQCCPQPGRCECKPAGCVTCPPGYVSILVYPFSGTPGDCCGVYACKKDTTG